MKLKLIKTNDGSSTISLVGQNEQYHSKHGAIAESKHVFIKNGLMAFDFSQSDAINILEVGLGTGLNAFLTFLENRNAPDKKIFYQAIEPNPLGKEFYLNLNFLDQLNAHNYQDIFHKIHSSGFGTENYFSGNFSFTKHKCKLEVFDYQPNTFNLVYFDAFGPRTQPELWTKNSLELIFNLLNRNGRMVTYCAKGMVKRTLKEIGFEVNELPGPPGKREMTCAIKK